MQLGESLFRPKVPCDSIRLNDNYSLHSSCRSRVDLPFGYFCPQISPSTLLDEAKNTRVISPAWCLPVEQLAETAKSSPIERVFHSKGRAGNTLLKVMIESQHDSASTTPREQIETGIPFTSGKRYFLVPEDVCIFPILLKKTEHFNVAKSKRLALLIRKRKRSFGSHAG